MRREPWMRVKAARKINNERKIYGNAYPPPDISPPSLRVILRHHSYDLRGKKARERRRRGVTFIGVRIDNSFSPHSSFSSLIPGVRCRQHL